MVQSARPSSLSRRSLLGVIAASGLAPRPVAAVEPDGDLVSFSYRYALPAFEMARLRFHQVFDASNPTRVPVNTLTHARRLADPSSRAVTTPNNDTLYSSASLDLTKGPVRIDVPDFGARYYSIALMDVFTNNFAYIGRRTTGTAAGSFVVADAGWRGNIPDGARLIRAPTPYVTLLMRILVQGSGDLDAVHRLQDSVRLGAARPGVQPLIPITPQQDPINFVAVVNQILGINPPPAADLRALRRVAVAGIMPGAGGPSPEQARLWTAHFADAQAALRRDATGWAHQLVDGWSYSAPNTGNFGTDYETRAAVALGGLLALTREEAIYAGATTDSLGRPLDPANAYRLRLPREMPVGAFWSLSMYRLDPDGRLFFSENVLHRYAIGDRTPGLQRNQDGSLDI